MTRWIAVAALAVGLATSLHAPASADEPNLAIERVIADQIAAFQRDDFAAAFAHAAPGIQAKFGTPEGFGTMVRQGYPMIHRPTRIEWGRLEKGPDGRVVKTVIFEDGKGKLYEAGYLMGRTDGAWRIHGVALRELPGASS